MSKEDKTKELERRVKLALEGYGKTNPYETLGVESTASNGEIRKAYRKLSLLYHPDKNVGPDRENADIVFKDIVIAFDILGDPEKREYFDSIGSESRESFNTYDDYIRFGQKNEQNFYQGNKLITALSEATWDRRVGVGENVWLVEFYAPWCSHCQQKTSEFRNIAEILADEQVEIGAVNCAAQGVMCNARFGIRQYPTLLAFSNILSRDESGKSGQRGTWALRQEYDGVFESAAIVAWLRAVAREWRWLARTSSLARITNRADFVTSVLSSTDFWIIIFLDGLDCASCAAAHTNALRLSASLRDFAGVRIGLVDCEDPGSVLYFGSVGYIHMIFLLYTQMHTIYVIKTKDCLRVHMLR
jgi:thiol-disulfide isomerase/thioredoxin